MASITINEISQNYTYAIGNNSYACVALPITASWGPALNLSGVDFSAEDYSDQIDEILDTVTWERFPATQDGIESFVSTYRGPASPYKMAKDFSYQMSLTLMSAGYDVLVCRMCPGTHASNTITVEANGLSVTYDIKAKYPGAFGNSLQVVIKENIAKHYTNAIVYVVDETGIRTAVNNLTFTTNEEYQTDSIVYIEDVESDFIEIGVEDYGTLYPTSLTDITTKTATNSVILEGGSDIPEEIDTVLDTSLTAADLVGIALDYAKRRYALVEYEDIDSIAFIQAMQEVQDENKISPVSASTIAYREMLFLYTIYGMDLLKDKLTYNHNRIIMPGWDDQDFLYLTGYTVDRIEELSPLHMKLMESAYNSRCATAYLDVPRGLQRSGVYDDSEDDTLAGYAQLLSRYEPTNYLLDTNGTLYNTHSALFAPWGQYKYTSTGRKNIAPPGFQALMIQRSMILNQSIQYEWMLPTNRKHNLNLGKLDYNVPKKLLDEWQSSEGVGVNVITYIPDLGTTLWGNSTLFEIPPATYNALENLSTRLLINAVENVVWRVGLSITFRYNNNDAYSAFYAGCTPLLDTMQNVGAIEGYYVRMSADLDAHDQIMANSVIGKIFLIVTGVINDITVDLIALPPGTDLSNYE